MPASAWGGQSAPLVAALGGAGLGSNGMAMTVLSAVKSWARDLRRDVVALYYAARDPRVPWYAKAVAAGVAAYALSPIDLIPDFIPVLGYLDDLVVLPLGIMLAVRLIPPEIMAEHRAAAVEVVRRPARRTAAVAIVACWTVAAGLAIWVFWPD